MRLLVSAQPPATPSAGLALDVAGPDVVTYGDLIERIADLMLVDRPAVRLQASDRDSDRQPGRRDIAGEDADFIEPLMQSLDTDLLPARRPRDAVTEGQTSLTKCGDRAFPR